VLVAHHHFPELCGHLVTVLVRLHVQNLARRCGLEVGSTREKKGGGERKNVRNSVWKFGTGNSKCRWRAPVYWLLFLLGLY
jgi:hypothetical protein